LSKSIFITGVAGFLGSHLAESLLASGYLVTGVDNFDPFYPIETKKRNLTTCLLSTNFRFIELDIRDHSALNSIEGNWDLVVHIAAKAGVLPSVKNPLDYASTNIVGTINILEFIRKNNIKKYLFASSSSVYGNNKEIPFSETQRVDEPISPYASSKRSCELINYTYHNLHKIDNLNLRLFTLYGPRQRPDLSIHKFTKLIENDQSIEMYGDGSTARDYTHVSDVVNGFRLAINYLFEHTHVYEIINIGNRNPIKLIDLISTLFEICGKPKNIKQMPSQAGDVEITFANIEKAEKLLGYSPKVDFNEGLKDFVDWFRKNKPVS
jgi:UDP-glucuronate 4-epimerase